MSCWALKPREDGYESIFCQMQPAKFHQKMTHNQYSKVVWGVKQAFKSTAALRQQPLTAINIADCKESHWNIRSSFFGFLWWAAVETSASALQWQAVNGWIFSNVISADPCLRLFFIFTSSSALWFHFRPDWRLIAVYYRCACLHLENKQLKMVKQVPQKSESDLSGVKENYSEAASSRRAEPSTQNTILSSLLSFI